MADAGRYKLDKHFIFGDILDLDIFKGPLALAFDWRVAYNAIGRVSWTLKSHVEKILLNVGYRIKAVKSKPGR